MNRMVLAAGGAGVVAAAALLCFVAWPVQQEPPIVSVTPVAPNVPATAAADTKPVSSASPEGDATQADARRQANDTASGLVSGLASGLATSLEPAPPLPATAAPEFDIVRIEPTGEAVVAGRAAPGTMVELLRNGEAHDHVLADQSGHFAMIPPPLPRGTYDLTLRSRQQGGQEITSKQSVAVVLEPTNDRPMVALLAPDKPTVVLSQPSAQAPVADTAVIEAIDAEPGGKLHVSGRAQPGAAVRLYLNDTFIASATAGHDGRLAVTIKEGVAPGAYRVRLDELTSNSGKVRTRAEVPFNVPDTTTTASLQAAPPASAQAEATAAQQPRLAAADSTVLPDKVSPAAVVVPKIGTIKVTRGDSLWRLSRRALGGGERYAVIYKANRQQIRNPNLIYPGQVLVVPAREARR